MKEWINIDGGFRVQVLWHEGWRYLRMESGPVESPQEMMVTYQGLTPYGARDAVSYHLMQIVGVDSHKLGEIFDKLGLRHVAPSRTNDPGTRK